MEEIRQTLAPLTDWLPAEVRDYLPTEAWWLVELIVVLAVLLVVLGLLRAVGRGLFRRRRRDIDWDRELRVDLDSCPVSVGAPSAQVYHVPVRLRLVVVAPGGKGVVVEEAVLVKLLERAVPGLGELVKRDQPRICIWPAQLSTMGFSNLFHRCTPTGQGEGEPSPWVLLAGRVQGRGPALCLGLGLWSEEATMLGRVNLEPHQWLDVLRLTAGTTS